MKVVCKFNNLKDISDPDALERIRKYISKPDGEVDLSVGKEYMVYGIVFWDNCPWLYLCPEDYDDYPKPFALEFFDIVDDMLSSYWKLSSFSNGVGEATTSLVFDEWANDPLYYESLIDGDPEAEVIFAKYRGIIDQE